MKIVLRSMKKPPLINCSSVIVFIIIICFSLFSCSSTVPLDAAKHIVMVDKDGNPLDIENTKKIFTESEFTDHVNGIIRGIERHYNKHENEGQKKKILIFAHGGLNSFNSSLDRAKKDYIKIKDADEYYPIFFNWQSSWYSSLGERLFTVRRGKVRGRFYRIISFPFVFASTLGKGIGNSLLSSFYQVENDLSTIPGYYRSDAENVDSLFVVFKKKRFQ